MVDLTKQTINGTKVEIKVSQDGEFYAYAAGEDFKADTKKELLQKLTRTLRKVKKVKLSIPVTMLGVTRSKSLYQASRRIAGLSTENAVLVGIHAGNGNILVREDREDAEIEQLTGFGDRDNIARRLTPEEAKEYEKLAKGKRDADDALYKFEKRVKIEDVRKLVQAEVAKAVDDPKEGPEPSDDPRGGM